VQPGDTLEVRVGPGHKGPHVTEVLTVDSSTSAPVAPRRSSFREATSGGLSSGTSVEETGTVKWFNPQKGYGFIQPSDGGKDVFVHISAVEQAGLSTLAEGQNVSFDIVTTDRGKTAAGNLKAK